MGLIKAHSSTEIEAPIDSCWAVVADLPSASEWQGGLERVEIVEVDHNGRAAICDTVTDAKFWKVHCRVSVAWDAPRRVTFSRVESDEVDALEVAWELEALGAGRTRATYRLAVDVGPIPLLARPIERALRPLVVGARVHELAREVKRRG